MQYRHVMVTLVVKLLCFLAVFLDMYGDIFTLKTKQLDVESE